MSASTFIAITNVVVTLVLGSALYSIYFKQMRTDRMRLKHELFDRRLEIFETVNSAVFEFNRDATFQRETLRQLHRASLDAEFLFDDDVSQHIDRLSTWGLKHILLQRRFNENPRGMGQDKLDEMHRVEQNIIDNRDVHRNLMRPYLKIEKV